MIRRKGLSGDVMIKFAYFDVGGVVTLDTTVSNGWDKMKKDLGVTLEKDAEFEKFFDKAEYEINKGLGVESLVPIMRKRFGLRFPEGYSLLADFVNRFKQNKSIWPVISEIQRTCRVGLLTNMYPNMLNSLKSIMPKIKWDIVIDSSIKGLAKPDCRIFKLAEAKAGVKGEEILFIDNSKNQIEAAKKFGWNAFLYDPNNPEKSSRELLKLFKTLRLELSDRVCPKCGSRDIRRDMLVNALVRDMAQNDFICNKCGYRGQFFPAKSDR